MRRPAYQALVEKSRAACVAAVETFNRASAPYREENFAILMINAWELLLKARIIKENGGKISSVYAREHIKLKNGKYGKRTKVRLTRYGSPHTIGVVEARNLVAGYKKDKLEPIAAANITALLDIRDHATHFIAANAMLQKTLTELSLAAVKNYVLASQKWFNISYADLNLAAIPISFGLDQKHLEAVAKAPAADVTRFLAHIKTEENRLISTVSEYSYSVVVNFDIIRKAVDGSVTVKLAGPGEKAEIVVSIDDDKLPPGFAWSFDQLVKAMRKRYSNFVQNDDFYKAKKKMEADKKLCYVRQLVPGKKKGITTRFYNPNILSAFDKIYAVKAPPTPAPPSAPPPP
jgi:hypothetical protein